MLSSNPNVAPPYGTQHCLPIFIAVAGILELGLYKKAVYLKELFLP
jgi:hypothetical protein